MAGEDIPVTEEEDEFWKEWLEREKERDRLSFWSRQKRLAADSKKA